VGPAGGGRPHPVDDHQEVRLEFAELRRELVDGDPHGGRRFRSRSGPVVA
jgi:hypothetical protein